MRGRSIMSFTPLLVIWVIFVSGISWNSLQSATLHRFIRASSLRCHCWDFWVRRVDVRIFNKLLPFEEVILEFFEGFRSCQPWLIDFFHFLPYLFDWKIYEILSRPGLTRISQMLRIAITLNWIGWELLLLEVHKIKSFSSSASSGWLSL